MSGSPSFAMNAAPFSASVPDEEMEGRVFENSDLCHVSKVAGEISDDDTFGIRVMLEIPIRNVPEPFSWGVWVTQSRQNFQAYVDAAGTDQRGRTTFGWMPVTLSPYSRTEAGEPRESLACDVHWQAEDMRPMITLHECDHPLYLDQKNGISWKRAVEIARSQLALVHQAS